MSNHHSPTFLATREYTRFTEFTDSVRRERYIGLCHGPPGVGKTLSARHYSRWDTTSVHLARRQPHLTGQPFNFPPPIGADLARTVFWTAPVLVTARQIEYKLVSLCQQLDSAIRSSPDAGWRPTLARGGFPHVELIIIDEADRLKTTGLEQLRDLYDRSGIGIVLIGMPGLQRRLSRYPQLYSRVGFAHEYRPLANTELLRVLSEHWHELGLRPPSHTFDDTDAIAAVARITGGNFRLIQRLFTQINRIVDINNLTTITHDVVQTARASLIIGAT